jgi:mRNA interferase HigB
MRIIARTTVIDFIAAHPETRSSLERWLRISKAANWPTSEAILADFPKAKVLNAERVRFDVHGGDDRLIVAFDFRRQVAYTKFIGTHTEYDRVDALTVSNH